EMLMTVFKGKRNGMAIEKRHLIIAAATFCLTGFAISRAQAQTQVDLRLQSRIVDFSAASSTKPMRVGSALPTTCSAGEAFFLITAAAGQSIYFCTATNIWTLQGGGTSGGSGSGSSTVDIGPALTLSNSATLALGANCSIVAPCHARVGGVSYTYTSSSAIIISSGTPVVRVYISDGSDGSPAGTLKVRSSASSGVTCLNGCVVENSQTDFPGISIPVGMWASSVPGSWDASGQDLRSALNSNPVSLAGTGITITQGPSTSLIAVDPAVVPRKFVGAGPPGAAAGSALGDFYTDTTNLNTYQCFGASTCTAVGSGNWVQVISGSGTPIDTTTVTKKFSGTGVPGNIPTSAVGDFYLDLTNNDTYECFRVAPCNAVAAGNWVRVNSGVGSAAPTFFDGLYAKNNGANYFPLYTATGLPDAATFTWANQPSGATEAVVGSHARHMYLPSPASNTDNLAIRVDSSPLSSTSFTLDAAMVNCFPSGSVNYSTCGIGLTNGSKVISFGWTTIFGGNGVAVIHWSNPATALGFAGLRYVAAVPSMSALRIVLAGGVLTFYISVDGGASYDAFFSESATALFPSASGLSACWVANSNWANGAISTTLLNWKVN
ncbi:MAG: hypothetical protein ABJC09_17820, partial [Terriglobia bacterium]